MESPLYKAAAAGVYVIETLRFDPDDGFVRLGLHMDRAERTCAALNYPFDRGACLMALGEAVGGDAARCRLTIDPEGAVDVTVAALGPTPPLWWVGVASDRLRSDDPWLHVKTSMRALYDETRANLPEDVDEMIFLNERDEVCEGTITSVFVANEVGYQTPPLTSGVLPGVLREEMLNTGQASESVITLSDLVNGFYVGNSLRGLIQAQLV